MSRQTNPLRIDSKALAILLSWITFQYLKYYLLRFGEKLGWWKRSGSTLGFIAFWLNVIIVFLFKRYIDYGAIIYWIPNLVTTMATLCILIQIIIAFLKILFKNFYEPSKLS